MLKHWEDIPSFMKTKEVRPYWEKLSKKRGQLFIKRIFDIVAAFFLIIILFIPMLIIGIIIKIDSPGPAFYRQERVTAYGRRFRIHKFRTMVSSADKIGTAVTIGKDPRITRVGAKLRRVRLDELPQLIDVLTGNMSFVGTRPEAAKYIEKYRDEWNATLLLPAGITSECSIRYKDEDKLLDGTADVESVYINQILPEKMKWNLESVMNFSIAQDIKTMIRTIAAVFGEKDM